MPVGPVAPVPPELALEAELGFDTAFPLALETPVAYALESPESPEVVVSIEVTFASTLADADDALLLHDHVPF